MTKRTIRDPHRIEPIVNVARGVVSSVFAQRHFRKLRDMVQAGPIRITIHGRTDMVVMTVEDFIALRGRLETGSPALEAGSPGQAPSTLRCQT